MLRLPTLRVSTPTSVDEVLERLQQAPGRVRLLAGGTDLLVNLKHGVEEADELVSLRRVVELQAVTEEADRSLRLGATLTLEDLTRHPDVGRRYPSLARAAGLVAGPHHRRMGTLGGNVCLNTRCVYVNQTHFWRQALGYCLKKDGQACHVVKGGKRCVAAASNDTAPVLVTLGARLVIASAARGERVLPISDFYLQDGVRNLVLQEDELLRAVVVPPPEPGLHAAYAKLRPRGSIDFPRLCVALAFALRDGRVAGLRVVLSALAARPLAVRKLAEQAEGAVPDAKLFEALAAECQRQAHPLTNIDGDPAWRRAMVPVLVKRVLREALESGASR